MLSSLSYQLDLVTPGSCPVCASFRKQMRQIPNFRMKLRARPQSEQRFFCRVENLGPLFNLSSQAFFAMLSSFLLNA